MNLTGINNICASIKASNMGQIYILAPDGQTVYGEALPFKGYHQQDIEVLEKKKKLRTKQIAGYIGWRVIANNDNMTLGAIY